MPKRLALVAASLFLPLVLAAPAGARDPTMPLRDVRAGMRCTGLSVVRGTTISSFDVEVLDVIDDPAGPRILVRVSGPAVEPGGIGPGFSGSPVYCRDGKGVSRNAGAISEGVGDYGNDIALVTPIEAVLGESPTPPAAARRDPALMRSARPLAGPLTVTGLSAPARRLLVRAGRRAGIAVLSTPGGPLGGFPPQTLRPGASVSTVFATGDIGLGDVGTVTYRDGDNVWAFGHPLEDAGPRSLFLQDAYVFGVIPNPISLEDFGIGTYKLTSAGGHTLGTLTNDADSAVVGKVGAGPASVQLQASASERGTGEARFVSVQLADERSLGLGSGLDLVAPLAMFQAVDELTHSLAPLTLSMCVRFRVRERRRRLGFCNDYFSPDRAAADLELAAGLVDGYDFSPLTLQEATARVKLSRGVREDVLVRGRALGRAHPGRRARLRLLLHRKGTTSDRRVTIRVRVPRSLRPGRRVVFLRGTGGTGGEEGADELAFGLLDLFGEGGFELIGGREPHSVRELAAQVRGFHRDLGIEARFKRRGRAQLVYRNSSVALTGSIRVPLRVVAR